MCGWLPRMGGFDMQPMPPFLAAEHSQHLTRPPLLHLIACSFSSSFSFAAFHSFILSSFRLVSTSPSPSSYYFIYRTYTMAKKKSSKNKASASDTTSTSTSSATLNHASQDHQAPSVPITPHQTDAQTETVDTPGPSLNTSEFGIRPSPGVSTAPVDNTQLEQPPKANLLSQQVDSDRLASNTSSQRRAADVSAEAAPIKAQYRGQRSAEHSGSRRHNDDSDLETERSPLLRLGTRRMDGYSSGGEDSGHGIGVSHSQPTTWTDWALENGLHPRTWNRQTYIKAGLLVTLVVLIILSFTVFRIQDHVKDVLKYIDQHKRIGAVLFILSYTVACTLFLPGSLFTVGAGFLFKPFPLALLVVLLGDVVASVWAFIFGRYVFHDWVKNTMSKHPKFSALDEVIKDDGWKIVVMLRLTPIPFNLITYFFSITSIDLLTVVWATCIGVLPGSCIGIWIGSLLKGLSGIDHPELETKNLVVIAMNFVFVICCILTLSMFGKRSLRKAFYRLEQHQALTSVPEVEVVVEGVSTVIHELEESTDVPPSLRNSIIDQLVPDDTDPSRSRGRDEETGEGSTNSTLTGHFQHVRKDGSQPHHHPIDHLSSPGFTRGEKLTFVFIAVLAVLNVCVCVPLYYHFANQDGQGQ
ncbi:snare associated Golgi protein-domain-containing protein [Mortierella sp. GBAus27b]|nr:snare associated Golgi protein-domain-containing protein [Mortierella sp. GBAus27b]